MEEKFPNLVVNDIVLIVDPNLPRNIWPKGKIVETFVAKDGHVRAVSVLTNSGVFKRPVAKIVKLEVLLKSNSIDRK